MNYKNLFKTLALFLSLGLFYACSEDTDDMNENQETYDTQVAVTDAAIDNANVEGAFVTISKVSINGKAVEGFEKTTIDLLAYQNGAIKAIGDVALESGTTSSITIELADTDETGQNVGNYILTTAGEKKALITSSKEIVLEKMTEIEAASDNKIVLDFDLRKLIQVSGENGDSFQFAADSEISKSIRAVNSIEAGVIEGTVDDSNDTADKIVVYAYEKGTYDAEAEAHAYSQTGVEFANAVNSSVVNKTDGSYELHFLEAGEYELHYIAYSDNAQGHSQIQGELQVEAATTIGLNILNLPLEAKGTLSANVVVKGMVSLY